MISIEKVEEIRKNFIIELNNCNKLSELDSLFKKVIGNKGSLNKLIQFVARGDSIEQKKKFMPILNKLKVNLTYQLNEKVSLLKKQEMQKKLDNRNIIHGTLDKRVKRGTSHPLTQLVRDIDIFLFKNNFVKILDSPIETAKYNFYNLNIDNDHPAFNNQDTFFISSKEKVHGEENKLLLRSHCTSTTARMLEQNVNKEFSSYSIGNVFRRDTDDATHSHQFMQLDLIKVVSNSNVWEFQKFLKQFVEHLFQRKVEIRFRSNYFPFTTPSFEVDVRCESDEEYCSICKNIGWIEILGAGLINKEVFLAAGYTEEEIYKKNLVGWAFGMGIDRFTCLKYGIKDIRYLYENRISFLKNFRSEGM